ncbi:MAG TPA: D-aminoacyl-tRNA deacylase [Spirochaetia bacterium]|nr:D-aminoacyl-tRNA deacylase [Spirochaetia bacterium]
MRAVIQRVGRCTVTVDGRMVGAISSGLLVYLGVGKDDTEADASYLAEKTLNLRIFQDSEGKMNLSVLETHEEILVVSQFTLYADARRGRRPSYSDSAPPELGRALYDEYLRRLAASGVAAQTGSFGASMEVAYTNLGPVTILLDSQKLF